MVDDRASESDGRILVDIIYVQRRGYILRVDFDWSRSQCRRSFWLCEASSQADWLSNIDLIEGLKKCKGFI